MKTERNWLKTKLNLDEMILRNISLTLSDGFGF